MNQPLKPRAAVERMKPYSPPTADRYGKLRLDFNENTVGCSPGVAAFLRKQIDEQKLAIYPEYVRTRALLADHFKVRTSELLLTNGTDEAVQLLVNTYVDSGSEILIPYPSYAMYRFYAELAGAVVREIPYRKKTLAFPLEELLQAVTAQTRAIFLANPNNPTGTPVTLEAIELIAQRAPAAVLLVDEAYHEFYGVSALPLMARWPNLFVSRTFSKAYGMAGMRVGCLFSDERNIAFVGRAQSPYSVNVLGALAVQEAIRDTEFVSSYVSEILSARQLVCAGLADLGIEFHESAANFILMELGDHAVSVRDGLREIGVLVRDRSYEIEGCVRVTIGTTEQMKHFLLALRKVRKDLLREESQGPIHP